MSEWNYTFDSRQGISHAHSGRGCQDSVLVIEGANCLVAALADGIGSRDHSEIAAEAAATGLCRLFSEYRPEQLNAIFSDALSAEESVHVKNRLIDVVSKAIDESAKNQHLAVSSMDCTLVFVCVMLNKNQAMIGRLGDSAVCVIRKEGESEAISARSLSANRTHTLLQTDAARHFELRVVDLSDEDIVAFILTSDGLNNEIYMKNSEWVCHNAEKYVNAVCLETSDKAKNRITVLLDTLTRDYDDIFRDDISYAVLSRAKEPISLPDDPNWLCTCGTRNHLWETYCRSCHMDFVKLYRNVDFAGESKAAFFSRLNADEARERRTIGLPSKSGVLSPMHLLLSILSFFILVMLCWNLWVGYSLKQEIRLLSEQTNLLRNEVTGMSEKMLPSSDSMKEGTESSIAEETVALNRRLEQFLDQYTSLNTTSQGEPSTEDTTEQNP